MTVSVVLVEGGIKSTCKGDQKKNQYKCGKVLSVGRELSNSALSRANLTSVCLHSHLIFYPVHKKRCFVTSISGLMPSISGSNAELMAFVSLCDSLFAGGLRL